MRTLTELFAIPRMFYQPHDHIGSVSGLYDLCREILKPDFTMVEVGCFAGVSSDLFSRFVETLYCVDCWADAAPGNCVPVVSEMMFDLMAEDHPNIRKIKAFSLEAATKFEDGSLDCVYIDANHDYPQCKEDILAWLPKVKPGGWICGHDTHMDTVLVAIHQTIGKEYKRYSDTSWAKQIEL